MEWLQLALSVLAGLVTAIPLAAKLMEYVKKAVREKNWHKMLDMVMEFMKAAEAKFETGADRKEWAMAMVKASAGTIDYDVDMEAIGKLIDSLCNMSKVVNAPEKGRKAGE